MYLSATGVISGGFRVVCHQRTVDHRSYNMILQLVITVLGLIALYVLEGTLQGVFGVDYRRHQVSVHISHL